MAAEDVQVQQNVAAGPGDDLPQGAASDLNALLPDDPGQGEMLEAPGEEADLELASPEDYEPSYQALDDDDDFLTGPTERPDEPVTAGITAMPNANAMSDSLRRSLSSLVAAANQPGASETMRTIVRWAVREANK